VLAALSQNHCSLYGQQQQCSTALDDMSFSSSVTVKLV